jgi:uncharacterized protein YhfF
MESPVVTAFWQAYCATRADRAACLHESYDAWSFGDGKRMADELGRLVLSGIKTATAGLLWEDEHFGWKTPAVGDKTIILDGDGQPLCVIETTAVAVMPFNAVDAAFARREGEGFETIDDWREAHWRYFARRCQEIGKEPDEEMPVLCQEFRVVHP